MTSPSRAFWISWFKGLGVAVLVGVFLAFAGAFGSGEAPLGWRLVYWATMMLLGSAVGGVIAHLFAEWAAMDDRPILRGVLMSFAITAPLTVLIWAINIVFWDRPWGLGDLTAFAGPVYLVSALMTALGHLLDRPVETHAAQGASAPPRFLDRVPLKLKGAVIHAVESEDHYLRIHTERGSDLILMRLSDAVAELEGLEGAQVHRSWWVARDAVIGARRGDGRATLELKGGIEAPVSRRYAPALRKAGWY